MKSDTILLMVLVLFFGLSACELECPYPSNGVWYCEELQAQFTMRQADAFVSPDEEYFIDELEDYVIVNGDRVAIGLESDRGATYVWIVCQELEHPDFYCGEIIYSFEFVSLTGSEYILKDDAGKQYTFLRIGDAPTDG